MELQKLNITNADKKYISALFAKNPDFAIDIQRFKTLEDRQNYLQVYLPEHEIFVRREYDGVETFVYLTRIVINNPIYKLKEQKGGQNEKK